MKIKSLLISLSLIITTGTFVSCGEADEKEYINTEVPVHEDAGDSSSIAAGEDEAIYHEESENKDINYEKQKSITADNSEAFVLTAGEWNDNENWGFFTNLVNTELISFPSYGLDPVHRISVKLENSGKPVGNQKVELIDSDNVIWTAKTDKNGIAYLFWKGEAEKNLKVLAEGSTEPYEITVNNVETSSQEVHLSNAEITIETENNTEKIMQTEVMFILDTTGSMGDEITYLQKDFSSIAEETFREGMTFSVNFYRDQHDDYITKCNPFTEDIEEVQKVLNKESADGGGDTPEAVAEILEETIINGQWSENSNKIAFLIFDAPPHTGTEDKITEAIESAAKKGIHIVPVIASNAERDTELFGRAAAIMTNSNYVFLTDDSGVGDSHLEPIIGSYNVELLHDIIVRNINEIAD